MPLSRLGASAAAVMLISGLSVAAATPADAVAPSKPRAKAATVKVPKKLRVGKPAKLKPKNSAGVALVWGTATSDICGVQRTDRKWILHPVKRGKCVVRAYGMTNGGELPFYKQARIRVR